MDKWSVDETMLKYVIDGNEKLSKRDKKKILSYYSICGKCKKIIPTLQNGVTWDMNHPSICKCKVKKPKTKYEPIFSKKTMKKLKVIPKYFFK